jgi:hypothetical protein
MLIILFTLLFANVHINKRSGSKNFCFNICGDARGYYAWLPAIFIYHDLSFSFFDSVEMKDQACGCQVAIPIQDYRYDFDGKTCDKYYPGTSFLMLPFFAIAHIATKYVTHYQANGYSQLYFSIMGLAGVFYYFLGMLIFLAILKKLALNPLQQALTILLVTFGSNIIFYIVDAPVYSHIYSFVSVAGFCYFALRIRERVSVINVLSITFIIGLILVSRPINISIVLMLPFIFHGRWTQLKDFFVKMPVHLLSLSPALIMPVILFACYKISTGHYFIYSYKNESFDFLHSHFLQFLFHYNNGLFSYTPLLLAPFLFLFTWYNNENRYIIIGLLVTLLVTLYIQSSWWCWWYGYAFGARTMLDFLPLFGIAIGLSLKQDNFKRYYYMLPIYLLCCVLTMILYHQKSHGGFMAKYPVTDYWAAIYNALGIK